MKRKNSIKPIPFMNDLDAIDNEKVFCIKPILLCYKKGKFNQEENKSLGNFIKTFIKSLEDTEVRLFLRENPSIRKKLFI